MASAAVCINAMILLSFLQCLLLLPICVEVWCLVPALRLMFIVPIIKLAEMLNYITVKPVLNSHLNRQNKGLKDKC